MLKRIQTLGGEGMLKKFFVWIESIIGEYKQKGIDFLEVVLSEKNIEKKSARVDFVVSKYLGRITLWETGESDIELLNMETEETVDYRTVIVQEKTYADMFVLYFESILKKYGNK